MENTFGNRLEKISGLIPDKPAIICGDKEITWKQLDERVNRLANALLNIGAEKKSRIAIMLHNSPEWIEAYLAANKIGAIPTNINVRYTPEEIKYILDNADAEILFLTEDAIDRVNEIRSKVECKSYIVVGEKEINHDDLLNYEQLINKNTCTKPSLSWEVNGNDITYIMYTGGTTGYPKGTIWKHSNRLMSSDTNAIMALEGQLSRISDLLKSKTIRKNIRKRIKIPGIELIITNPLIRWLLSRERLIVPLAYRLMSRGPGLVTRILGGKMRILIACPMYHATGYGVWNSALGRGATSVFLTGKKFDPKELWETVESKKVNSVVIVGDAFARPIVEFPNIKEYDKSSLRAIISSGLKWSPEIKRRLQEFVPGIILLDAIGSSEYHSAHGMIVGPDDKKIPDHRIKLSSPPHTGLNPCRCINENGEDITPGSEEPGQLITGGAITDGYWKDPERTEKVIRTIDGRRWFFTGDMGAVDKDGYFYFLGRGSQCINTGGEKVYPEEVENIIEGHPKVERAGITGVSDERWGEAVTAIVQLKKDEKVTAEEIIDFCRDKMAGYKKPKHVVFVDSIPLTGAEKILYEKIKDIAEEAIQVKS